MVTMENYLYESSVEEKINILEPLLEALKKASGVHEKLEVVNQLPEVQSFLETSHSLSTFLAGLTPECDLAIKSILAIGQGPIVFNRIDAIDNKFESLREMLQHLIAIDKFYDGIGGIVGYYVTVLKLIAAKKASVNITDESVTYHKPPGIEISKDTREVRQAILWGIEYLPEMAEIYPVGGAGDRLKLCDESTREPLPAAQLNFCGRTLLEGLIRDLQAREYLYYKLHGLQLTTPVVMMTSHEKNNHTRILEICESKKWFGRPRDSFMLFTQPLVPVVTEEGNLSLQGPMSLTLKPGGHGAIWKLALDCGVFDWLEDLKRRKALLRQINNPAAGTDYGLLAFTGIGCHRDKSFGFASCFRLLKASEGVVVLVEVKHADEYEYSLTNIEYTDFELRGVAEAPESPGSKYSAFPANTNILFVDIEAIKKTLQVCSIPGMLINMKHTFPFIDAYGNQKTVHGGRLESTMQNIADHIINKYPSPLKENEYGRLKSYVTYNDRRKTISVTKNELIPGKPLSETPEGCYYELLLNAYDLLKDFCRMDVPEVGDEEHYIRKGPGFILQYNPALGPLYKIIGQKIRKGKMHPGSELLLEISDLDLDNLDLKGSLIIHADNVSGHRDEKGNIVYSDLTGKCELKNVKVINEGIDRKCPNTYYKNAVKRKQALRINLHGHAEFMAENVSFHGDQTIDVPAGHRMIAQEEDGKITFKTEKISKPTWKWGYALDREISPVITKSKI